MATFPSVEFVIGNTYTRLKDSNAKLDITKTHRRVHNWTLYVDVIIPAYGDDHDADLIRKVQFDMPMMTPSKFVCHCPIELNGGNGLGHRWRFQTRQQTYGPVSVRIAIIGRGGTVLRRAYRTILSPGGRRNLPETFVERNSLMPHPPVPIADVKFGIELELSTSADVSRGDVANLIASKAFVTAIDLSGYAQAVFDSHTDKWRLASDGSITCSISNPNCNTLELVSPILRGGAGLQEVDRVMNALAKIPSIKINKSMGFHVHVNVQGLTLSNLKSVCQNFVKYELAMDRFMPKSRRENDYCRSNRSVFGGLATPNKIIHDMIDACSTKDQLGNLMSPEKYYKLNMKPLVSGRQPTIEFRQHSGTSNREKVKSWIRFCVAFVHNSARLGRPSHLASNSDVDRMFDMLFMHAVKDRHLRDFYRKRINDHLAKESPTCCDGCDSGRGCVASRPSKIPRH
jgi:hypothetical protein